ncbi:MAG: hypothetical protein Fur005_31170 [Roseiflexaceae bacterium]
MAHVHPLRFVWISCSLLIMGAAFAAGLSPLLEEAWRWVGILVIGSGLMIAAAMLLQDRQRLEGVALLLVGFSAMVAFLTVSQYRFLGWEDEFGPATRLGMLISARVPLYFDPWLPVNASAALFETSIPIALGLLLIGQGWRRWVAGGALGWLLPGLFITSSRGAWLALLITLVIGAVAFQAQRHWPAQRWVLPLLIGAVAIGVAALVGVAVLRPVALDALIERAQERTTLYRNSLILAMSMPFSGVGAGSNFMMAYSRTYLLISEPFLSYPHNLLLSIWLWHGLLGLIGFAILLINISRLVRRTHAQFNPLAIGISLSALGMLLHGITDAPQYDRSTVFLSSCLIVGMLLASTITHHPQPLPALPSKLRYGLLALAIILGVANGPWLLSRAALNMAWLQHNHVLVLPDPNSRDERITAAASWIDQANRLTPNQLAVRRARGLLASTSREYARVIADLGMVLEAQPTDQAVRKALGYAMIWEGSPEQGAMLLSSLKRATDIPNELRLWEAYWAKQGDARRATSARLSAQLLAQT